MMKAKIEFRPTKYSGSGWAYNINFLVEDLIEFLEFCEVGNRNIDSVKELLTKKPRKKPYVIYKPTRAEIYPHENRVTKLNVGIHYICQHGLDILPANFVAGVHNSHFEDEAKFIGTLFPDPWLKELYPDLEETYPVTSTDISSGLMLSLQEVKKYHDNFAFWIVERRKKYPFEHEEDQSLATRTNSE